MTTGEGSKETLSPAKKKFKLCETDDSCGSSVSHATQGSASEATETEVAMDTRESRDQQSGVCEV